MPVVSASDLLAQMQWRYATKQFDTARKIPDELWSALEDTLVLTPSSFGLQPWKFVVVTDQSLKERLVAHSWGQKQPADCSHHVVFAVRDAMVDADIDNYIRRIVELRGGSVEALAGFRKMMQGSIVQGMDAQIQVEWASRQAYIALGNLMTAAALVGVDTCPMEGIDPVKYDEVLGLRELGYKSCVACAVGYRAEGDKYATLPKIRFAKADVVLHR